MSVDRDAPITGYRAWVDRAGRLRRHPIARRVTAVFGALLVLASFYYLWAGLAPWLRGSDWRTLSPRWALLVAALCALSLCPILRGIMWWSLLSALGAKATVMNCLLVQARANLVKYVPGGFWELAGKAYLSGHTAPERAAAGVAAVLDLGAMVATGLVVALALMPTRPSAILLAPPARWGGLALVAGGLYAAPWILNALAARAPARWFPQGLAAIAPRHFHLAVLVMLAHWAVAGVGLGLLAGGLGGDAIDPWFATHALAVSATAGLLVVIAPAGVGVREALLTRLLGQRLALGPASLVAILSRVGLVAGELIAFVVLAAVARIGRARAEGTHTPARSPGSG